MSSAYVTSSTDIEKLPIDTVLVSNGGAFTINNDNEIVVGAGVKYVRLGGNVTTFGGSQDRDITRAGVRHVRTTLNATSAYLRADGGYNTLSLPTNIVSVQEGDRFWLWFRDEQRSGVTIAANISNIVIEAIF